jgi:3-hydroxyisobutyrate dehydrogenase-like beta-hydroxyacid dehydrogenase
MDPSGSRVVAMEAAVRCHNTSARSLRKDLDLALATAARFELSLPLTAAARELYTCLPQPGVG